MASELTLMKRLDSAICKEPEPVPVPVPVEDSYDISEKNRGKGEKSADGDSNGGSLIIICIDDLRKLRIKELREQASRRGVSSSGTKKELLERLCKDSQTNNGNTVEEEEDTNKCSAVLDQYIPKKMKKKYHVLQQGDEIYDATLTQTNIGGNNNKFYIIQALESNDGSKFWVYHRWGRICVPGMIWLHGSYTCVQSALDVFKKKFYDKTKNNWSDRKQFVSKPKLYKWVEKDYGVGGEIDIQGNLRRIIERQLPETKLEKRIADFISLICNATMMEKQMKEIGYNVQERPLRDLNKAVILEGYEILKRIDDAIGQNNTKKLGQLSEEFYKIIPHHFGFKKMSKCTIDTLQKLKLKLEMVEALGEIEVAKKLLNDTVRMEDRLLSHYEHLHCELTPIEVDSKEFKMIEKYMKNTHANTPPHSNYTAEIVQIFRASRHGEADSFSEFSNTENRMLLWHGSRLTNWVGILSEGLRIAPPEAPVTGYMFGKGVYFADMFSKSANYCHPYKQAPAGVLLLCEVALGEMVELLTDKYDADKLPQGKLSTKGVGATGPDMSEIETLEDGVVVPLGHLKQQFVRLKDGLYYNEYVVYDVNQIKMRYIVNVKFNFKKELWRI